MAPKPRPKLPKIVALPKTTTPYTRCFYSAVQAHGVNVVEGSFSAQWILHNISRSDWIHFHWPSFDYTEKYEKIKLSFAFLRWVAIMLLISAKCGRIAWTAHNVLPHERSSIPAVDVAARHLIISLSEVIFCHGKHAAEKLIQRFPRAKSKIRAIPHGNWIDCYRNGIERKQARQEFNINSHTFLFLCFGAIKQYKNIEHLVEAYGTLIQDSCLIIAGKCDDIELRRRLVSLAAADSRVIFHDAA